MMCNPYLSLVAIVSSLFTNSLFAQSEIGGHAKNFSDRNTTKIEKLLESNTGKRLTMKLELSYDPEKIFDLCDDRDAIMFGLDGGTLSQSRINIGLDCNKGKNSHRFGFVNNSGDKEFANTWREALAKSRSSYSQPIERRIPLGYSGPDFLDFGVLTNSESNVRVIPATLYSDSEYLYGMAINLSNHTIQNVSINYLTEPYNYPLSVQPGEAFPFLLRIYTELLPFDASKIEFSYITEQAVDPHRAILVTGMPGYWGGGKDVFPAIDGMVDIKNRKESIISYYQAGLELKLSSELGVGKQFSVTNPFAVVAIFDDEHRVIQIQELGIKQISEVDGAVRALNATEITSREVYAIGVILPSDFKTLGVWVGAKTLP